jgi:hypothetical protein
MDTGFHANIYGSFCCIIDGVSSSNFISWSLITGVIDTSTCETVNKSIKSEIFAI